MPSSPPAWRGVAVAVAVAVVQISAFATWGDPLADDAYISLRYAQNLATGRGLVFNLGERVEGFTNPLWTLLAALFTALGLPALPLLQLVGCACFVGLIFTVWRAAEEADLPRPVREAVPVVLAATTPFAWWAMSGLETVAFAWALAEGTRRYIAAARDGRGASVSGAFALAVAWPERDERARRRR